MGDSSWSFVACLYVLCTGSSNRHHRSILCLKLRNLVDQYVWIGPLYQFDIHQCLLQFDVAGGVIGLILLQ
jgi:hypothetical protein